MATFWALRAIAASFLALAAARRWSRVKVDLLASASPSFSDDSSSDDDDADSFPAWGSLDTSLSLQENAEKPRTYSPHSQRITIFVQRGKILAEMFTTCGINYYEGLIYM